MGLAEGFNYAHRGEGFGQWLDMSWAKIVAGLIEQKYVPDHDGRIRTVDVGTAAGKLPAFLNQKFDRVDAFAADMTATEYRAADHTEPFIRASIDRLPFADSSFGLATAMHVFEHLINPVDAMSELKRVTAIGGLIVAAYPKEPIRGLFCLPAAWRLGGGMGLARRLHLAHVRPPDINHMAEEVGLTVVRHHQLGFRNFTMPQFVSIMRVQD